MPNRRPVTKDDPEIARAREERQQQAADVQAAAAAESQRHTMARLDDLTRRTVELHVELRRRDRIIDELRQELAALKAADEAPTEERS